MKKSRPGENCRNATPEFDRSGFIGWDAKIRAPGETIATRIMWRRSSVVPLKTENPQGDYSAGALLTGRAVDSRGERGRTSETTSCRGRFSAHSLLPRRVIIGNFMLFRRSRVNIESSACANFIFRLSSP